MQQFRINNNINATLAVNDKTLEDINVKMNNFSSAINDQLIYNKKIEEKIAQLAAALPVATNPEQVKAITIRGGKSTSDPVIQKGQEGHRQHQQWQTKGITMKLKRYYHKNLKSGR
jgi:hypothetical protein